MAAISLVKSRMRESRTSGSKLVPFVKTVLRQFYGKLRLINDSRIIVSDIFQTELSLTSFRSNTNRPTGYDSWKQSI